MKKLPVFKQSGFRAWAWMGIMLVEVVSVLFALWYGLISSAAVHAFLAVLVFWVDQLEKEVTRRNESDRVVEKKIAGLQTQLADLICQIDEYTRSKQ